MIIIIRIIRIIHAGTTLISNSFNLRRSSANDKIFKLFFLHPFLASTIYNNTIKNKFDIG